MNHPTLWPFASLWQEAWTFEEFLAHAEPKHAELWRAIHRLARVPSWATAAAAAGAPLRLVVLSEDWCGDAVNTVPILAKWAEAVPQVELRILRRDAYPQVMDRYLTDGVARSIPVVIVLSAAMEELGWWGPRPRDLQTLVMEQLRAGRPKAEIYPDTRRWYARDKGATTLRDVLAMAGLPVPEAPGPAPVA